ncbi:MAG: 16S rRNA (guanine(966)-N(2))-methyltransferase RsmD [Lachnospiraceae bacterium]|nr:16S rRNA (guanine(966)-N(2))-methyltransferase RsmD [Lachnospiraceae bacterium]
MRVIAGRAKHLQLKAPKGIDTRPTTDRIKETLFNMLKGELDDIRFLDLFAGSGGIGIEALSRGAREAVFVEKSREACSVIRDNLAVTHLDSQGKVFGHNVMQALKMLRDGEAFEVAFMDPPYGKGLELQVLQSQDFYSVLAEKALVIVEADLNTFLQEPDIPGFRILKEKIYKTNKHIFLEKV